MDDIKLALLGNKEAAKRLTEAGVLLPCCGKPPILKFHFGIKAWTVECAVNGHIHNTGFCSTKERAIDTWNTRAPILSESEWRCWRGWNEPANDLPVLQAGVPVRQREARP